MRKGPFNNRGHLPAAIRNREPHPRTEDARADQIYLASLGGLEAGPADPDAIFTVGDAAMENLPGAYSKALSLLARSSSKVRGGVCEKFASVVLGMLSEMAPPGAEACSVAWSGDHHYVVVKVGTSRWWVADPWPHNTYVHPWAFNYFRRDDTVRHIRMEVVAPVQHMYGVVFDEGELDARYQAAVAALPHTPNDGAFENNWANRNNLHREFRVHQGAMQYRLVLAAQPDSPWVDVPDADDSDEASSEADEAIADAGYDAFEDGVHAVLAATELDWG
jgi:hypothetical protein